MGYSYRSAWSLRTAGGQSLGKGIERMGLSVGGGMRTVDMVAYRHEEAASGYGMGKNFELKLKMTLTGVQFSIEKGADLIQYLTGAQVSVFRRETDRTAIMVNQKNPRELQTSDFLGECALISYDFGKATVGQELAKLAGKTYLYLGMGTTIIGSNPNWLQEVVDNADRPTVGGNWKKFNANDMPLCNARAASVIELNERSLGAKLEVSVALFSGQIAATGMNKY
jgi:hypothetical protein